jgi:hypothetical protein
LAGRALEKHEREVIADARGPSLKPHVRALAALFPVVAAVMSTPFGVGPPAEDGIVRANG